MPSHLNPQYQYLTDITRKDAEAGNKNFKRRV